MLLTGYSCAQVPSAVHTPSTSTVDFIYNWRKQEKSGFQQEEAAALMVTSASVGPLAPLIYQHTPEMKPSFNQKVESVYQDEA